jgi:hypothetical protein
MQLNPSARSDNLAGILDCQRGLTMFARQVALLGLLVVIGCGDHRSFSSVDSWWKPPPGSFDFTPLDSDRFAAVKDALQPEAQAALLEAPAKRVSAEEAARLTGKQFAAGGEYILLRGVVLNEGTGHFNVGVSGRWVHIEHRCLGHHAVPMARKALIAVLPALPDAVYVSCSMAE